MDTEQLIKEISAVDVDIKKFTQLAIEDDAIREEIVRLILTHPHIMVYYHCYYILDAASLEKPDLFYDHWDDFAALLEHKNSYHRDIGMTLIANLTQVDRQNKFEKNFEYYFSHLHDVKFLTSICCVQNSFKILKFKPQYTNRILPLLLSTDTITSYPLKQKELMKGYILPILDERFDSLAKEKGVLEFIRSCTNSASPKTRSIARGMVKKYALRTN
jgi:hypothetical protein